MEVSESGLWRGYKENNTPKLGGGGVGIWWLVPQWCQHTICACVCVCVGGWAATVCVTLMFSLPSIDELMDFGFCHGNFRPKRHTQHGTTTPDQQSFWADVSLRSSAAFMKVFGFYFDFLKTVVTFLNHRRWFWMWSWVGSAALAHLCRSLTLALFITHCIMLYHHTNWSRSWLLWKQSLHHLRKRCWCEASWYVFFSDFPLVRPCSWFKKHSLICRNNLMSQLNFFHTNQDEQQLKRLSFAVRTVSLISSTPSGLMWPVLSARSFTELPKVSQCLSVTPKEFNPGRLNLGQRINATIATQKVQLHFRNYNR